MFPLTIAAVNKNIYQGEVHSVTCPGSAGELTILANHMPLITTLREGSIIVRTNEKEEIFTIKRGLLEVRANRATILL